MISQKERNERSALDALIFLENEIKLYRENTDCKNEGLIKYWAEEFYNFVKLSRKEK